METETIQSETQRENKLRGKAPVNCGVSPSSIFGLDSESSKVEGSRKIFEEPMTPSFLNLLKTINSQIQKVQ